MLLDVILKVSRLPLAILRNMLSTAVMPPAACVSWRLDHNPHALICFRQRASLRFKSADDERST